MVTSPETQSVLLIVQKALNLEYERVLTGTFSYNILELFVTIIFILHILANKTETIKVKSKAYNYRTAMRVASALLISALSW